VYLYHTVLPESRQGKACLVLNPHPQAKLEKKTTQHINRIIKLLWKVPLNVLFFESYSIAIAYYLKEDLKLFLQRPF